MLFRRRQSHTRRSLLRLPKRSGGKDLPVWKIALIMVGISIVICAGFAVADPKGFNLVSFGLNLVISMAFGLTIWGSVTFWDSRVKRYQQRLGKWTLMGLRGFAWMFGTVSGWLVVYEAMNLVNTGTLVGISMILLQLLLTSGVVAVAIAVVIRLIRMGATRWKRDSDFLRQKELLTTELETARNVQRTLLPTEDSRLFGFDISGTTEPAVEIGGDYYDYLSFADGTKGILVADAAGKGIPAALVMAKFQGMAQALSIHVSSPHEFFTGLNDTLRIRLDRRTFITAGMLTIDFEDHCSFFRAGHNPLFLFRRETGEIEQMQPQGLALGLTHGAALGASLAQADFAMKPGDVALLYSDGLNEATDAAGDAFGDERVAESLRRASVAGSAVDVKTALLGDLATFVGDAEPHDDVTIVVVKKL